MSATAIPRGWSGCGTHSETGRPQDGSRVDNSIRGVHTARMSSALPPKPRIIGPKVKICIVASKYNEEYTDALVDNAIEELNELVPHARIDLIRVPGAFEIPVAVSAVLEREGPAAVLALGLIMRGATQHGDLVAGAVTNALMELSLKHTRPVIHEVVVVDDEKQAYARCIGATLNRGKEAARAAAAMVDVFQELDRSMPRTTPNTRSNTRHG